MVNPFSNLPVNKAVIPLCSTAITCKSKFPSLQHKVFKYHNPPWQCGARTKQKHSTEAVHCFLTFYNYLFVLSDANFSFMLIVSDK